jgi:hypothetical protein
LTFEWRYACAPPTHLAWTFFLHQPINQPTNRFLLLFHFCIQFDPSNSTYVLTYPSNSFTQACVSYCICNKTKQSKIRNCLCIIIIFCPNSS